MPPRKLTLLTILTVLLGVTAAVVLNTQERNISAIKPVAVVPELKEKIARVDRLIFTSAKHASDVLRGEDGVWRVKQLEGYPADMRKIRQLFYRLEASKRMEKKTADPELLHKLSLSDDRAMRIRLYAKGEEKPLLDLLTGDGDPTFKGTYVRAAGDTQSWLVSEDLTYGSAPIGWADEGILNLDRTRVRRILLTHRGRPPLELERKHPREAFRLVQPPKSAARIDDTALRGLTEALENLKFVTVAKAGKLPGEVKTTARFLTADGLEVQVELASQKGKGQHAARISARLVPENAGSPSKTARKEAETIRATTSGWIYTLSPTAYAALTSIFPERGE